MDVSIDRNQNICNRGNLPFLCLITTRSISSFLAPKLGKCPWLECKDQNVELFWVRCVLGSGFISPCMSFAHLEIHYNWRWAHCHVWCGVVTSVSRRMPYVSPPFIRNHAFWAGEPCSSSQSNIHIHIHHMYNIYIYTYRSLIPLSMCVYT